jgi:hypothetical protein
MFHGQRGRECRVCRSINVRASSLTPTLASLALVGELDLLCGMRLAIMSIGDR